jgi:hypothetical protein
MGIKPTGKSFKYRDVDLFTFNDAGQITEHRSVQSGKTRMDIYPADFLQGDVGQQGVKLQKITMVCESMLPETYRQRLF